MSNQVITDKAIAQGAALMARTFPEHSPEWHEEYVRTAIMGVREHLVQRHLYDAVVRELNLARGAGETT